MDEQTPENIDQPAQEEQPTVPQPTPSEPVAAPAPQDAANAPHATPGSIVLQWLTYAFWGWTVLALASMIVNVLSFFIASSDTSGFSPFGIAALLVLLPLSAVCDFFYSKHEPQKKVGSAALVMVIHAVIFALLGIGAVIAGVFTLVMIFTDSTVSETHIVALISSGLIAVLYGAAFLRTLNPAGFRKIVKFYTPFMALAVGAVILVTILGPVLAERKTRDDRLIENGLGGLARNINDYANSNDRLPADLNEVDGLSGDAETLVDRGLVQYRANTKPATSRLPSGTSFSRLNSLSSSTQTYYYELCVDYKAKSSGYSSSSRRYGLDDYDTYPSAYSHPAGNVCYKIKTRY